ncbi:C-type lectin lectoxin-Lio2-like [Mercenaria mercenaria]|uniref:C-type lectin lectoxin-Lio2-like n=1 Tax=Mercenaria mercenaria TaxID=6596 RepID=UPI00234F5347|nr:C-type lectin lectoxin-Lio2-like [Mercenaria mercenaria]
MRYLDRIIDSRCVLDNFLSWRTKQNQNFMTGRAVIPCLAGPKSVPVLSRRITYKVIEEKMYWDEGQKVCEILGGRLADIKTQAEEEFLERYVFPGYSRNFWLGATDFKNLGTYLWLDGTKVSDFYVNWSPRQPNREEEHCVIASNLDGWGWRDTDCQSKQFSLCEF